jgi:hypothetical protein
MGKLTTLLGICALACAELAAAAGKGPDYAGSWKKNCLDEFGLQISAPRDGMYSVLFCKSGFCSAPGAYRPNTRIENDPMYDVVSAARMKVRHQDGSFDTYIKCPADTPSPARPR